MEFKEEEDCYHVSGEICDEIKAMINETFEEVDGTLNSDIIVTIKIKKKQEDKKVTLKPSQ